MFFIHPHFLWLLLLLVPLVWQHYRHRTSLGAVSLWSIAGLRALAATALIVALARPVLLREDESRTIIHLVDVSAGVDQASLDKVVGQIEQTAKEAKKNEQHKVILFADKPWRVASLKSLRKDVAWHRKKGSKGSNMAAAIDLASASVREGSKGEVRLYSDGRATAGNTMAAVRDLAQCGLPLKTITIGKPLEQELILSDVKAVPAALLGETLPIEVTVEATDADVVGITVTDETKEELASREVTVEPGRQTFALTIPLTQQGTVAFDVRITGKKDTLASNNQKQFAIEVLAPYRIGLIGTSEAKSLGDLLAVSSEVKEISLKALKEEKSKKDSLLDKFDLIVLADTPANELNDNAIGRLAKAVKGGCGLLVTGGKRSFGPGGYLDGPLAKILPVKSVQKMEQRDPSATLVIIIDTSGSMGSTRVSLAKEIARLAIKRLKPHDKAGVVEFYGSKRWAAPIQPASNAIDINRALNRLSSGGGTVILPAIEEAYFALLNVRTRTKHVLVLTDGGIETGAFEPLIRKMADHGMTLSTVLVGPSTHSTFLTRLAQWGRGKSYHAPSRFNLPEILIKQPESSLLSPWIERATQMTLVDPSVLTEGLDIDHAPLLTGYVETEARSTADILIGSKLDHPILARWQYGLGHVATLTTQLAGPWSEDLVKWDGYGPLFAGLTRSLTRQADRMPIRFTCSVGPEGLTVFAKSTVSDEADRAASLKLAVTGVWGEEILHETLEPIQPGQWLTRIPLASLVASDGGQKVLRLEAETSQGTQSSAAVVVGAKDEFCTVAPEKASMAGWEQACQKMITQKNKEKDTVASQAVSPVELRSLMIILALVLFFVQIVLRRTLPSRRLTVNAPKNLATSATAVLVLVLGLMTGTASAAMKKPAEDLLPNEVVVKVQALYHKGKSNDAGAMLKQAVTDEAAGATKKDVSSHAARLAWICGDSKTAAELLVKPKGEGKHLCREELLLGTLLLETNQPARAIRHFQEAYKVASTPTDRRFAMAMEIHSARKAGKLNRLANEWLKLKSEDLHKEQLQALIQILGELDRHEDAFRLVERPGFSDELSEDLQKEVVSLAIDAGKTERAMKVYHQLLNEKPHYTPYLSAAARLYLLEDRRDEAIGLFKKAIDATNVKRPVKLMHLADAAADLALYDQAKMALDKAAEGSDVARIRAMIKKVDLVRRAGDPDTALDMLASIRPLLDDHPKQLLAVAEAYDRYGDHVEAFALLKKLYEKTKSEDILAQVAWLSEESGDTEAAYTYWKTLWYQTTVPARRRHAKTRMLDLASRNGKLVDMVLDIEEKLDMFLNTEEKPDINQRMHEEVMLLVDIYSQTNDPISASEILYTFGKKFGGQLNAAKRLVRVYVDCELFARAEAQLYKLIKMDPKNAVEYYEQIAMLAVERGRPHKAFQVTQELLASKDAGDHAAEFSAGIYELLKMYDEAIKAYDDAYKKHPSHIEILLLWGRAMKAAGKGDEAIQRFLDIAKTCDKDDQFVIAIDGLLNLSAGPKVLQEALLLIERRLAANWDKVFLYDLSCDLLDGLGKSHQKLRILQQSLIAAGMRRPTALRELMDEAAMIGNSTEENIVVDYGRILLALGDEVPPTVFLQIGQAMLNAGDVKTAATIFRRAGVHGGFADIGRRVAELYETAGKIQQAESMLHELLITEPDAIDLLIQAGGLSEQTGHYDRAFESYLKSVNLLMDRVSPVVHAKTSKPKPGQRRHYYRRSYNLSEVEIYLEQAVVGLVATARASETQARILDRFSKDVEQEFAELEKEGNLKESLEENPRLARRCTLLRRVALALHRPDCAVQMDRALIKKYPQQKDLSGKTAGEYMQWGYNSAAGKIGKATPLGYRNQSHAAYQILQSEKQTASFINNPGSLGTKFTDFIPSLLAKGRNEDVRRMFPKFSASQYVGSTAYIAAYALDDSEAMYEWVKHCMKKSPPPPNAVPYYRVLPGMTPHKVAELVWNSLDEKNRKDYLQQLERMVGKNKRGNPMLYKLYLELTAHGDRFMDEVVENEGILKSLMPPPGYYRSSRNLTNWFSAMSPSTRIKTLQLGSRAKTGSNKRAFLLEVLCEVDPLDDAALCNEIARLFKAESAPKLRDQGAYYQLAPVSWYALKSPAGKAAAVEIAKQLIEDYPNVDCVETLYAMATARKFSGSKDKNSAKTSKEALEVKKLILKTYDHLVGGKKLDYEIQKLLLDMAQVIPASYIEDVEKLLKEKTEKSGITSSIAFAGYGIYKRLGDSERGLEMLKRIFELAPGERTSSYAYFTVMKRLGRDAELADALGKTAQASAETALCNTLSEIYGRLYRFDDAIRIARQDNSSPTSSSSVLRIIGFEAARGNADGVLREIRRFLIQGRKSRFYFYGTNMFTEYRGGIQEFDDQLKATSVNYRDRKSIYELLADQPFAVEEWDNILRAATPQTNDLENLVLGYAKALVLSGKAEQKIEEIHTHHVQGVADRRDYLLLLYLLSELPERSKDGISKSLPELDELILAVQWSDRKSVMRLALALSRTGHKKEARTMFRWAIAAGLVNRQNEFQYPQAWETIDHLTETYPKEERTEQRFHLLESLKPAPVGEAFCDVFEQERFKRLLSLAETCPEAAESLQKEAADLQIRVTRSQKAPAKETMAILAALQASLDHEDAFRDAMKKSLDVRPSKYYGNPLFFDYRTLLPPAGVMKKPEKYLRAVISELKQREQENHLSNTEYVRALALLGDWQAKSRFKTSVLSKELDAATKAMIAKGQIEADPATTLWIIDSYRLIGEADAAYRLSKRLLEHRNLPPSRFPELFREIEKREGKDALQKAIQIGKSYSEHPILTKQ